MKQAELIIKSLLTRGEQEVTLGSASKFRKFTRRWNALRINGELVQTHGAILPEKATYWFVSRNGSLRVGRTSSDSRRAKPDVKDALIQEAKNSRNSPRRAGETSLELPSQSNLKENDMAVKKAAAKPAAKPAPKKSTKPADDGVPNKHGSKTFRTPEAARKSTAGPAEDAVKKQQSENRAATIVENPLVVIDPKDAKIPLEHEPISAVAIEGLMDYRVEGTHLRLLGLIDPNATPTLEQRVAIATRLLEVGPKLPKYVKTIEAKQPDLTNAEEELKKEKAAPKPTEKKANGDASKKTELVDGVPLKKICADIDIEPKIARRILRAKGKKPGGRWEWKKDEVDAIKKMLKNEAVKLAAKE